MEPITQSWDEISHWLASHLPAALKNLRPAASDAEIEQAEKAIGLPFPDGLKALYRLHDGETNNWPPGAFDDGHWFLPLSEMAEHHQSMAEFAEAVPVDSFASWKSSVEDQVISIKGPVKPHIFSRAWIPLTSSNGDVHRYLDFDPAPGGHQGQVIEVYPEACTHQVLASSLEQYFSAYAKDLQSGRYQVEDECIVDAGADGESELSWGLPAYLKDVEYERVTEADISQALDLDRLAAKEKVEIVGQMGFLLGSAGEIVFSVFVADGTEHTFLATSQVTKGFGAIAVDQYAKLLAVKNDQPVRSLPKGLRPKSPELLVLEYTMVKGPNVRLKKRPWWKFW